MEKITKDIVQKFVSNHCFELRSTHSKLCVPIIDRIYRKMNVGIRFSEIKVANDLICDGHHRYLASRMAGVKTDRIEGFKTSAMKVTEWKSIVFEEKDWDSPIKIKLLNVQDAMYNNVPLEILVERLNCN